MTSPTCSCTIRRPTSAACIIHCSCLTTILAVQTHVHHRQGLYQRPCLWTVPPVHELAFTYRTCFVCQTCPIRSRRAGVDTGLQVVIVYSMRVYCRFLNTSTNFVFRLIYLYISYIIPITRAFSVGTFDEGTITTVHQKSWFVSWAP